MSQALMANTTANSYSLTVHYMGQTKSIKNRQYTSIQDLKSAAIDLFVDTIDKDNIIIFRWNGDQPISLDDLPAPERNLEIYIQRIRPRCTFCQEFFTILEERKIHTCANMKCEAQYCKICVDTARGMTRSTENIFTCGICHEKKLPKSSDLITNSFFWPLMAKRYGDDVFSDLERSTSIRPEPLIEALKFRINHLESLKNQFQETENIEHATENEQRILYSAENMISNFQKVLDDARQVDSEMQRQNVSVTDLKERKRKVKRLIKNLGYDQLLAKLSTVSSSESELTQENVENIDSIHQNLKICLAITQEIVDRLGNAVEPGENLEKARSERDGFLTMEQDLLKLRSLRPKIQELIDTLLKQMIHAPVPSIKSAKFILLVEEIKATMRDVKRRSFFPKAMEKMKQWQDQSRVGDEFQPNVKDLFEAMNTDIQRLTSNSTDGPKIRYRIGLIGDTSCGKTSLGISLGLPQKHAEMVSTDRSTLGFLETNIDLKHSTTSERIPVTIVDIQGATEDETQRQYGTYTNLIREADCDLYILVFDRRFSSYNQKCKKFVEDFGRKCILVRSKIDQLFEDKYQEQWKERFSASDINSNRIQVTTGMVRELSKKTVSESSLEKVYAVSSVTCSNGIPFDSEKLKQDLLKLAAERDVSKRMVHLGVGVADMIINNCFRRDSIVMTKAYKISSAIASVVPALDQLPAYLARLEIRKQLGVRDGCGLMHWIKGTTDSLPPYLQNFKFSVPKGLLRSGHFEYLYSRDRDQTVAQNLQDHVAHNEQVFEGDVIAVIANIFHSRAANPVIVGGSIALNSIDDIIRAAVPAAAATVKTASTVGLVFSLALIPIFAPWSYYDSGRRMDEHLHKLCDDIFIVMVCFILHQIPPGKMSRPVLALASDSSDED